ncbi:inorganic phosphate transporter, PiT family [Maridesulfovibrio ferrireducens]|uniref:Phosphate transporter n=1 Tax=Maridesulfovibrio ferrireducens TaxID=246191 RepID=A0A1G9BTU5_9BACT|nr:inorganic phosphate transporter [Maridesulfovibrio ferrireducens]SDK42871.1 inorganic phosphate transporter, PiT family [Maridesulfovibrio ferrireducens]
MDIYDVFFYLSLFAGFMMAFNLGANDVANSMASAVGAKAISIKQAVFIAGTLNFAGAVFLGSQVTATVSKGIINADVIADPKVVMVGMFSALLAAGLWVLISTLTALPVSSTHSIVGSILGFGLVAGGPDVVNWMKMVGIVMSWIISPFFAATIAYLIFTHIRKTILFQKDFIHQAKKWAPIWMGLTVLLIALSFLYKTPVGKSLNLPFFGSLALAFAIAGVVWLGGKLAVNKLVGDPEQGAEAVEETFRKLQIGTSCYVALSQGANDVANAIGPVAAIYLISKQHVLLAKADVPLGLLVMGGVGIAIGIALLGYKVMGTVGTKITVLTNTRGFAVDFGAATTVLIASNMGLPVSSTHAAVGSVVGVGLARGFSAVNFQILGKIVLYWVLTVPIAALTSIIIFTILKWICL